MAIEDTTMEALAKIHGENIAVLTAAEGAIEMVARPPSDIEFRAFKVEFDKRGKERIEAEDHLVSLCCVHPGRGEVRTLLEKFPGALEPLAIEIMEMAGAVTVTRKKYQRPSAT